MAELTKVSAYPSQKIHWAKAARPELWSEGARLEDWHYWRTICGRDVIGHMADVPEDWPICRNCQRVAEHARKVIEKLTS